MAGLSYHICGKLEVAFKALPSSQHQHCTDEAQKAETVLSAVSCIYVYIYIYTCFQKRCFFKNRCHIYNYAFSALVSFLSTSEKTFMQKTEGNGHNGITDDMYPPCLSLFSTVNNYSPKAR